MLREDEDDINDSSESENDGEDSEAHYVLPDLVKGSVEESKFTRGTKVLFKVCTTLSACGYDQNPCYPRLPSSLANYAIRQLRKLHSSPLVCKPKSRRHTM